MSMDAYADSVISVQEAMLAAVTAERLLHRATNAFDSLVAMQSLVEKMSDADGNIPFTDDDLQYSYQSLECDIFIDKTQNISMQGASDTLKRVWAAMQSAMKRVAEALMKVWDSIFSSAPKLRERLKALDKRVNEYASEKRVDKEKTVAVSGYNNLGQGNRMDATTVTNSLKAMNAALGTAYGLRGDIVAIYQGMASKFVQDTRMKRTEDEIRKISQESAEALAKKYISFDAFSKLEKLPLPGDRRIATSTVEMPRVIKTADNTEDQHEIAPWSYTDCFKVLDEAIKVLDIMIANQSYKKDIENARKVVVKATNDMVASVNEGGRVGGTSSSLSAADVNKRLQVLSRFNTGVFDKLNGFGYNAARSAYNVVNLMMANKVAA